MPRGTKFRQERVMTEQNQSSSEPTRITAKEALQKARRKATAANISKSAMIRELHDGGWKTADIARQLNIRYQFARNVIENAKK
jgi:hypothetical protein